MIYFTSDLHFNHQNVIDYCKRPFKSKEEMNEELIKRWNSCVSLKDTVYVLGDLTLSSYKEVGPLIKRLNGNKILIKGNHDHFSNAQYESLGFTVYEELKLKLFGKTFRLSHYPYAKPWYKRLFAYKSELRFMDKRPPKIKGEWLLHGHSHVKYKISDNEDRIHVGVDAWDFYPVSIKEIESLISRSKR